MKIVVIGATGLIGRKVVETLRGDGHEALAASPESGVSTLTGEGLAEALAGASVVVDVSDSPSFEDAEVDTFFETFRARRLVAAESAAGVTHHVALSVVGAAPLSDSGYIDTRIAEEKVIRESSIPYSIIHATQLFESVKSLADAATDGSTVRLASVLVQPMAADDVASAVGRIAVGTPINGVIQVAGPELFRLDDFIRRGLSARKDPREVVADPDALGATLSERTLVPNEQAQLGATRFEEWLNHPPGQPANAPPQPGVPAPPIEPDALTDNAFRGADVPPGSALLLGNVAVFNVAGRFCATQAKCTHRQGPLSEGTLDGSTITCPYHGAQFNVCSGAVLRGPARDPIKTYEVTVEGGIGRLQVGTPATAKTALQSA